MSRLSEAFNKPHLLKIGQPAPAFSSTDVRGETVELGDNHSKYLLVAFLRYAGCPWCNLAIHRLTLEHDLLQKSGCTVIAFIQSSKDNIIKNIYERHEHAPGFPVIADRTMKTYRQYGVKPSVTATAGMVRHIPHWVRAVTTEGFTNGEIDGNLFLAPATFLLSPYERTILRADYSSNLYEHATFTALYEAIAYHKING